MSKDIDQLEARVQQLERQNRYSKTISGILLVAVTAVFAVGAVKSDPPEKTFDILRAKRLVLCDDQGKMRIDLRAQAPSLLVEGGQPMIEMYRHGIDPPDSNGRGRFVSIGPGQSIEHEERPSVALLGSGILALTSKSNKSSIYLRCMAAPELTLSSGKEATKEPLNQVELVCELGRNAFVRINREGKPQIEMVSRDPLGHGGALGIYDKTNEEAKIYLRVDKYGNPLLGPYSDKELQEAKETAAP